MAPRKRHGKTQFVIPEEVQEAGETGWTYKTEAAGKKASPTASVRPIPETRHEPAASAAAADPMQSGMLAISYGIYAFCEMIVFTTRMMTLPVTIAGRMFRG
jgi:hypothetical protein